MSDPPDERTRSSDIDFRPGASTSPGAAEPTRAFPIVLGPPGGPDTASGPAYVPGGDERTVPFLAVLAAGEQATQVPDSGMHLTRAAPTPATPTPRPPVERTLGFAGVLPVPTARALGATIEAGQDIGGFRVVKRLALRPTCELFVATHAQHGECVLQVLAEGMAAGPAGRAFLLDARARTTLEDPRLVRILGLGDLPRPWVALERLSGDTLRQVLDREGPLGPERAGRVVLDLARGLSRLHARRIAHGDITPRDVRLEADRAVLTGFGTWKTIEAGVRRAFPGGPGLGAAIHSAPELFVGERVTPAADVWALGLLLIEATTGRPWIQGEPREVMTLLVERALPPIPPELPPPFAAIARRCLERSAGKRYPTAQEVAQALHPLVPDRAPGVGRPLLIGAGVVAALALIGAVVALIAHLAG